MARVSHSNFTTLLMLGRDDVVPGMVAAIQTFGELLHWHPHLHALVTCGAFTSEGDFLELPELDLDRLRAVWQEAVFALYLAEDKIEPEVVENMRTWPHSGFICPEVFEMDGDLAIAKVDKVPAGAEGTCRDAANSAPRRPSRLPRTEIADRREAKEPPGSG